MLESVSSYQPTAKLPARLCLCCERPIEARDRLNKFFCKASCRAFVWSRANRQFSSTITVADFENVREPINQLAARVNRVVVRYALVASHPIGKVARQIGDSTFPPKDRKTKRMPDETGRTCFSSVPYYSFSPWFEGPRVPVVGNYRVNVWFEGNARPTETNLIVDVRKSFPAVDFYDEKTGQRYTLKGEVIPPKPPKAPMEKRKREPAAAIGPQPERAPRTERVPEVVPAAAAQRAPDAELVAQVKKLEEEQARQTKERTELLATIDRERALRLDLEQKLRLAKSMPKPPAKDDSSSRLQAAENRALDQKLREVEQSVGQLQARATEQEQKIGKLEAERDDLAKERTTLARQILKLEDERKEQAKAAERERAELAAKLSEVERQRDELASKSANQAAPAAVAVPAATAGAASADEGTDSTPPNSPTGIEISRLAYGKLPPVSSPKTGPPSLGILGQNHRPPIRGSANKKHKRR